MVPLFVPSPLWALAQSFVPAVFGRRVPWGPGWCVGHLWDELQKNVLDRSNLPFEDPFDAATKTGAGTSGNGGGNEGGDEGGDEGGNGPGSGVGKGVGDGADVEVVRGHPRDKASLIDDWNHPLLRSVELASANGHSNAFSMASVGSMLAACGGGGEGGDGDGGERDGGEGDGGEGDGGKGDGGEGDGGKGDGGAGGSGSGDVVRLMSQRGLEEALGDPVVRFDAELETTTKNTRAGWTVFDSDVRSWAEREGERERERIEEWMDM